MTLTCISKLPRNFVIGFPFIMTHSGNTHVMLGLLALLLFCFANSGQAAPIITVTHADSIADWDAAMIGGASPTIPEQGGLNWEYGFYATDNTPASFNQLETFFTSRWVPSATQKTGGTANSNPRVGRDAMHPGFDGSLANRWSVRRWTSIADGEVRIFGSAGRTQVGTSDGVTLRFYHNGLQLNSEAIALPGGNDLTQFNFDFPLVLAPGDILDFAVDENVNPSFDNTLFSVQITQDFQVPEPSSMLLLTSGSLLLISRRRRHARGVMGGLKKG